MRNLWFAILLVIILTWTNQIAQASPDVIVENPQVEYTFGGQITFRAVVQSESPIENVILFLQPQNQPVEIVEPDSVSAAGEVVHDFNLTERPLRVFSNVIYWYQIITADGEEENSASFEFFYEDNRFEWRSLEAGPFHVFWYDGDIDFAQKVINTAQEGLSKIQGVISAPQPEKIKIFAYASALEMQATLRLSGQSLVAGHANPDLEVIAVSLPPGPDQTFEIRRQIPHELTHVMIYQAIGPAYENVPSWFNEGLASTAELFPNPDYQFLLDNAYQNNTLIPIENLCESFPLEASNFLLAYAESTDFTRYLFDHFGTTGIESLLEKYAAGMGCKQAVESALGFPLSQLEQEWRQEQFQESVSASRLNDLMPWFVLLILPMTAPILLIIINRK